MFLLSNFLYSIAVVARLFLQFEVLSIIVFTLLGLFNPYMIPGVKSFFWKDVQTHYGPGAKVVPFLER
ncbi:MAG TPA: hypothetical protein PLD15_06810 [Mesotoga sp.]|nr:hypothetical protein [Mesotoga sp.]